MTMDKAPAPGGTPLCPRCLAPVDPVRYYCARCGWDTGQFTPYIEYVNIRWMANAYGNLWQRLWHDSKPSRATKVGYFLFILLSAPAMLVGLPFVWLAKRQQRRAGHADKAR